MNPFYFNFYMAFSREPFVAMMALAAVFLVAILSMGFCLIDIVLKTLARWKIYEKAGVPSWKSLIPFYNVYQDFKLCWSSEWGLVFVIVAGVSVILGLSGIVSGSSAISVIQGILNCFLLVVYIIFCTKLSRAFGHRGGWAVGLVFFNTIFLLMIGLGKSQYVPAAAPEVKSEEEPAKEETPSES